MPLVRRQVGTRGEFATVFVNSGGLSWRERAQSRPPEDPRRRPRAGDGGRPVPSLRIGGARHARLCPGSRPARVGRSMPSLFIMLIRVVRFNPSRAAAPPGPPITQPTASSASRISARSESRSVAGSVAGTVAGSVAGTHAPCGQGVRQHASVRQDHGALDHVLQLADVPRPVVRLEGCHGGGRDGARCACRSCARKSRRSR